MNLAKLMNGQSISMALLMIGTLYTYSAYSQDINYLSCKRDCQAKKAIKKLRNYNLDLKKKLADPLGSEVCVKQLKGKISRLKNADVCIFKDTSAIELSSLHRYSERFARPTP